MNDRWLLIGAGLAGLGVAAGAFGAHALDGRIAADLLEVFETGSRYHVIHALALLVVGLACRSSEGETAIRWWNAAGWLFAAGILVFGGSLYALALTGRRWLGAVTPLGGVCFLAGWVAVAIAASRASRPPTGP